MSFTTDSRNIKSLLASTLENTLESGVVHDAIFDAMPLIKRLKASGNLKVISGGERLRIAIDYAKSTAGGSYADLDTIDITRQDTQTSAFFNWKQYAYSVTISGKEMRINKGNDTKLFDLLDARVNNAAQSMLDDMSTDLYLDGTGNGSKNITGLAAGIETAPGTLSYAGVPTTNTAWVNQVQTGVGAAAVNFVPKLRTIYNDCSQGSEGTDSRPDLIIVPQTVHESYEALMFPHVRIQQGVDADAGLGALKFKGADVIWSDFCTAQTAFVLNTNHLYLFVHEDANFSESEAGLQKPVNQDGWTEQIYFMGNLLINNRRKQGKMTGITS